MLILSMYAAFLICTVKQKWQDRVNCLEFYELSMSSESQIDHPPTRSDPQPYCLKGIVAIGGQCQILDFLGFLML